MKPIKEFKKKINYLYSNIGNNTKNSNNINENNNSNNIATKELI